MRTKLTLLSAILGISILTPIQASAVDRPDFADPFVPQIKSITMSYETKQDGGRYSIDMKFNLVVRVHRNPLSTFEIFFSGGKNDPLSPCQAMSGTTYTYGNNFYTKPGNFTVPSGLVSRKAEGDWFIETHQFQIPGSSAWPPMNQNFPPCVGTYKSSQIQMRDLAGHGVRIIAYGGSQAVPYQINVDDLPLDSDQSACILNVYNAKLCTQLVSFDSFDMTFTNTSFKSESQITIVDFQAQNKTLTSQVDELNNRVKLLTSDKTVLQSQVTSLTSDKNSLQSQVTLLTSDKTALQSQISSLTLEKSVMQNQISSLTNNKGSLQNQINSLTSDKSALQSQLNNVSNEKSALQNQVSSLTNDRTSLQKRLAAICKSKPKPKGC